MGASSSLGKSWLQRTLQGQGEPVIQFLDEKSETYLSAANLYNLAIEKYKALRRQGVKPENSVLVTSASDPSFVTTLMAALCGGYWLKLEGKKSGERSAQPAKALPPGGGLILFTSGTSSKSPREVFLTWEQVLTQVQAHSEEFDRIGFEPGVRLSLLPKHHCFGLIVDFLVGLDRDPVILLSFQPESILRRLHMVLENFDVHVLCLTPRIVEILLNDKSQDLKRLKKIQVLCGGATLPKILRQRSESTFSKLVEGYGQTECGPGVLLNGTPIPFCEVRIDRDNESEDIGRLLVKTPTLGEFEGKVLDENGFFDTGDLAFIKEGRVYILGRKSDFLKNSSGEWTSLEKEKEDILLRFGVNIDLDAGASGEIVMTIAIDHQHLSSRIQKTIEKRFFRKVTLKFGAVSLRLEVRQKKEASQKVWSAHHAA
ncbi:acyl--CoA ligase [bacterium]|nr:acyl--CoA ligase [bacterium]